MAGARALVSALAIAVAVLGLHVAQAPSVQAVEPLVCIDTELEDAPEPVTVGADGSLFTLADEAGVVKVLDTTTNSFIDQFDTGATRVDLLEATEGDGPYVFAASLTDKKVWRIDTSQAPTPSQGVVVTSGINTPTDIVSAGNGSTVFALQGNDAPYRFDADTESVTDNRLSWLIDGGGLREPLPELYDLAFNPDAGDNGTLYAVGAAGSDMNLYVIDPVGLEYPVPANIKKVGNADLNGSGALVEVGPDGTIYVALKNQRRLTRVSADDPSTITESWGEDVTVTSIFNFGISTTGVLYLSSTSTFGEISQVIDNDPSAASVDNDWGNAAGCPGGPGTPRAYGVAIDQSGNVWTVAEDGDSDKVVNFGVGAPSQPLSVTASLDGTSVDLEWAAPASSGVSAITGYSIQSSDDGGVTWNTEVADSGSTTRSAIIDDLAVGEEYVFRVAAINGTGTSPWSTDSASVTILATTPAAPTDLSATALDQGASVSFTPGSDRGSAITDYEYQLDSGDWEPAGTTSSPVVIDGLTNGTTYSVKIRGVNDNGDGDASAAVDVTPVSSSDPPGAPASLEALPGGSTLDLSWEAPNPGGAPISDYEYKTDSDPWLSLGTTNSTVTITTDSAGVNLDPASAYSVQIRAVNANGPGDPSASVTQTPGVPLAPQNPSSAWSADSLALSWSAATANGDPVTEYQIVVSQLSQRSGFRMLRSGPGTYTTTSTSFAVTGLRPVSTYTVTLSARNGRGWGLPTSFTVEGTGQVEEDSQTPPSIIQQIGLPPTGTCEDVMDGMFGTQTYVRGGWGRSWAMWMNGGLGGAVCTRMLVYSHAQGRWVLAE